MNNNQAPVLTLLAQDDKVLDFQPQTFEHYIGQTALKQKLEVYTKAAKMRQEPLDHMLLFGPPGLGKTTLAHIMAHIMGVRTKICSGPLLDRTGDLVALLSGLEPRDILFIDEIHRMPTTVEEVLYSALERFQVEVIIGQGPAAQVVTLPLQPFTLIGATTKAGMISAPLRSRFGITERLDYYSHTELAAIVQQSAHFLGITISPEGATLIAQAARGTPRIAKKIVRRVRDFVQVQHVTHFDQPLTASTEIVTQALNFLGIDTDGLTRIDYALLHALLERFNGGPAGLETVASLIGEDTQTVQDVHEPYLLRRGYLEKTPRGRQIPESVRDTIRKKIATTRIISHII